MLLFSAINYQFLVIADQLPANTSVSTGTYPSLDFVKVEVFTNSGSQTITFPSPTSPVKTLFSTVTSYVNNAKIYFTSNGIEYTYSISPNSNTQFTFQNPLVITNVRMSIEGRGYSDDAGHIGYIYGIVVQQKILPLEDNVVVCGLNCEIEREANVPHDEPNFTYGLTQCQNTPYFLKFVVSGITDFSGEGILRLRVIQEGGNTYNPSYVNFHVTQVSNSWSDESITFDTQPAELTSEQVMIIDNPGILRGAPYEVKIPLKDIKSENGIFSIKVEDTLSNTCDDWLIIATADNPDPINRPYFEFSSSEFPPIPPLPADSDGDGINDSSDSCPTQAENFNGYQDSDGCPDTKPSNQIPPPPSEPPYKQPSFDFSISTKPNSLMIDIGGESSSMIYLGMIKGYPEEVTLSCSDLPEAVGKCIIENQKIVPTNSFTKLLISATPFSPTGDYTASITATGGGITHYADVSVTITPTEELPENGDADVTTKIFDIWLPAIVGGIISATVGALFIRKKREEAKHTK